MLFNVVRMVSIFIVCTINRLFQIVCQAYDYLDSRVRLTIPVSFLSFTTTTTTTSPFIEDFPAELQERLRDFSNDSHLSGEDKINIEDFLAGMIDKSVLVQEDRVRMVFEHFKKSDDNHLQISDLLELFGRESLAREIMGDLDTSGENRISFEEFSRMMAGSFSSSDNRVEIN